MSPSSSRKSQNGWCWFGAAGKFSGPKRAKSNQAQYNKKSAGVMIAGCVRPDSRKSLSLARSTSALALMAVCTSLGMAICPLDMTLALSTVSPVVEAPCKNRQIPLQNGGLFVIMRPVRPAQEGYPSFPRITWKTSLMGDKEERKMKRKLAHGIGAAFVMALLAAVFSMGASAAETMQNVMYLDENGKEQTTTATVVESLPGDVEGQNVTWTGGWYVVPADETVSIYENVTVEGTVNLILEPRSKLEINGDIIGNETASLKVYSQVNPNIDEWQDRLPTAVGSLYCYNSINLQSLFLVGGCVDGNEFWFTDLTVNGGYLNGMGQVHDIVCNNSFDISSGYAAGNLQCGKATVSGGTVEGKISSGEVEITGGTINSSEYEPYVIESTGDIKISGGEINGRVSSSNGDIIISDGQVNGSVNANGYNYNSGTVTITGGTVTDVNGVMVDVTDATLGSAYASETLNIRGNTVIDGDVSAGGTVNMYSGTIGGVYMLATDMGSLTVNIVGGTVTGEVNGSEIYVGDKENGTSPVVQGGISVIVRDELGGSVTVRSGTVVGQINTPYFIMEGGSVNSVECQRANIDGGKAESLSIESDGSISNGTIDTIWMYSAREDGLHGGILSIYGGTFLKHPITYKSVIMDYTGSAFGADYVPNNALYLYKEGEIWNGIAGGVAGGG